MDIGGAGQRVRGFVILTAGLAAAAALTCLTACGTGPARSDVKAARPRSGCATTVHGVVSGPGSLVANWLPAGYRLQTGAQSASSLPQATYAKVTRHPDPPRIMLGSAGQVPLAAAAGGFSKVVPAVIQGHRALVASGQPAPQLVGVYWKPSARYVISVVGYKVPRSIVLRVAQHVSFVAPGVVALPVTPGKIVTRRAAIAAAERGTSMRWRHATAKLSSWTEIAATATRTLPAFPGAPGELTGSPWRPVWAVQLTGSRARQSVVVVDAASGRAEFTIRVRGRWFGALTDRDSASTRQCPGGSSALVPFGVLTRSEAEYGAYSAATPGAKTSVQLVLSTEPAVNGADKALYGGCVQQSCSIDQLVWVTITTVRADPGKTVACLPGGASVPAGYKPKQVKQYYIVAVPNNVGIGCGSVPEPVRTLKDLAPPIG
jgi:hypothetical protein